MQFGRRLTAGPAGVKRAPLLTGSSTSKRSCQVGVAGRPNRRSAAFSPVKHNEPAGRSFAASAGFLASWVQTALRRQNKHQLCWFNPHPQQPEYDIKPHQFSVSFPFMYFALIKSDKPRVKSTLRQLKQLVHKDTGPSVPECSQESFIMSLYTIMPLRICVPTPVVNSTFVVKGIQLNLKGKKKNQSIGMYLYSTFHTKKTCKKNKGWEQKKHLWPTKLNVYALV